MELNEFINQYMIELLFGAALLSIFSLLLVIINIIRTNKIMKKYKRLMRGAENKNIETMLYQHLDTIQSSLTRLKDIELTIDTLSFKLERCMQHIGIVRYNAFDQMGGDQSFSIALMDDLGNGFVLTGLFGRNASSSYAKPLQGKGSSYSLSTEEKQAIDRAFVTS